MKRTDLNIMIATSNTKSTKLMRPTGLGIFLILNVLMAISPHAHAARVDTLRVYSQAMQKELPAAVVLPASYSRTNAEFPVLYLLHGGNGGFRDWLTKVPDPTLLHRMADRYNIIIVAPEGGSISYYFDSPHQKDIQYTTFISQELREAVDRTYRTVADKKGRIIAGLSMGGHGAFYISARYPELYSAAGSMSGVMDINTATWDVPEEFKKIRMGTFEKMLGPPENPDHPYRDYTAVGLTEQMKENDVRLIFDCGVDDFLIGPNRTLHQKLLKNGTPHVYIERPGGHTWEYWGNALPYHMLFFHNELKSNGTAVEGL